MWLGTSALLRRIQIDSHAHDSHLQVRYVSFQDQRGHFIILRESKANKASSRVDSDTAQRFREAFVLVPSARVNDMTVVYYFGDLDTDYQKL